MDNKYGAIFTPWKIGNVEIKNRIVMCSMGGDLFVWVCRTEPLGQGSCKTDS